MDPQTWFVYFLASLGLALSPGPNGLLALTHGALHGPRRAVFTALGGTTGFVALIAASMFGIGALLQTSSAWLLALKWVGGAYLVWLGVQTWRAPPIGISSQPDEGAPASAGEGAVRRSALYAQALLTALTNPKALLFFLAFLPQFIDPQRPLVPQFMVMAGTYAAVEIAFEVALAAAAYRISPWLARSGRGFNRGCGAVFMAIGALLPLRS